MPTFSMMIDKSAITDLIGDLRKGMEDAARPAAQAAAQVFYDAAKRNVRALGRKTGNLERAIYQAFMDQEAQPGVASYRVSWNKQTAPHGQLVEFGHIQSFKSYVGKDGKWYTAVRPEALGKKRVRIGSRWVLVDDPSGRRMAKPRRRASAAEKAKYYVALASPRQVAARPFLRPAFDLAPAAMDAATNALMRAMDDRGAL